MVGYKYMHYPREAMYTYSMMMLCLLCIAGNVSFLFAPSHVLGVALVNLFYMSGSQT